MTSSEIRQKFLDFFESKQHAIVPSAPMVIKDDPTLMFTNAGMNQFKDVFLGNAQPKWPRVANSQKCLRVSGKHNDLEEVGHDNYHHTMFEMLGNWSFGDYFKKEAINWAWEFLTEELKISKDSLYVSVFEGDKMDGLEKDQEAYTIWLSHLAPNRIVSGSKKDNFWEMGDTGPCGPCSEIHVDMRDPVEKLKLPGEKLVNQGHPEVIEIWNLVFIQYNRKADGTLVTLPRQHIDTGMGFERLCRAVQKEQSNYDTDVFKPVMNQIGIISGIPYGKARECDVATRVIADHLRTVCFAITDGQLPSNNKGGYVIRRILRRAVRYGYTYLNLRSPFMGTLLPSLISSMGKAYPELQKNETFIKNVLREEEESFLRTLSTGIALLDKITTEATANNCKIIDGKIAFELYDTFGFPLDLTELIAKENGMVVNRKEFEAEMDAQKSRARNASLIEAGDWIQLIDDETEEFIGYDYLEAEVKIVKYRKIKSKGAEMFQLVFNITPFYAESGGQVGDSGYISNDVDSVKILDTKKENNLIIHISSSLPSNLPGLFKAVVNSKARRMTANHHTATHILHQALREILGNHVEQKGSLVHPDYLRFDFAHFQKVTYEEIRQIEHFVNNLIRQNIPLKEYRELPISVAREMGAIALFGEKYGDVVRAIEFGSSLELCGGTHAIATGQIGYFKIVSESSIAAGIRRIEAVVADRAQELIDSQQDLINDLNQVFKGKQNLKKNIEMLVAENSMLSKQVENMRQTLMQAEKKVILNNAETFNGVAITKAKVDPMFAPNLKDLAFNLRAGINGEMVAALGCESEGKAILALILSESLATKLNAVQLINMVAPQIGGGGGGQPFFATAGGKNPKAIDAALAKLVILVKEKLE